MTRLLSMTLVLALTSLLWVELHAQEGVTFTATELLGRPTDSSVTVNVLADEDLEVYFQFGTESGVYTGQTDTTQFPGGDPIEVVIDGLQPNTRYYYRMVYRQTGGTEWIERDEHSFHTQRTRGSTFTFTLQSDSHAHWAIAGISGSTELYERALLNVLSDNPDFHLDLGDAFQMDYVTNVGTARSRYLEQRPFFGLVSHSSPIFLVIGNWENEEGWHRDGTANNVAIFSTNARKRYYLNPIPGDFYSGSESVWDYVDGDGLRENYYAWEWGDALFVVLDPYWHTTSRPHNVQVGGEPGHGGSGDNWDWTLGEEQYNWFKQTLQGSNAKFKFVFSHQVTGGTTLYGRGGVEASPYYEWGGRNSDSTWGFDTNRPGWETPIHQLMVENGVTIFFHGHDHVFVKQDIDGMVYQECPQPQDASYGYGHYASGGYASGDVVANSGHLRVTVSESLVTVDYVRAYLPGDGTNGEVAYSYTINANPTGIYGDYEELSRVKGFSLSQNYPNPFNPVTSIQYTVGSIQTLIRTTLKIYNIQGELVRTLVNEPKEAGSYQLIWDGKNENGKDVASGIYFCKLKVGDYSEARKMILLK